VGAALGPVFSTCSPTYFLVLATVLPQHFFVGLVYLMSYAVGLSLALLVISFLGQRLLEKIGTLADPHSIFKKILGAVFILVGVAIMTGADKRFETYLLNNGIFDITKVEQHLLTLTTTNQVTNAPSQTNVDPKVPVTDAQKIKAPEFVSPDGFINTEGKPLALASLRGKVVLLDVWTYSCINCQRTLPHINALYAKYKDQGFVVVGLHTPEFAFEHIQKNVEDAVLQFGIKYPVVLDNEYGTWNAYGNQYWPRQYLIDQDGYIVYDHIGEGGYEETEMAIQKVLAQGQGASRMATSSLLSIPVPTIDAASSETYFGAARNEFLGNGTPGKTGTLTFAIPSAIVENKLYLGGVWNMQREYAESTGKSSVVFRYTARGVYFVAGSEKGATLSVFKDDVFVKKVIVTNETLYHLIDDDIAGTHTLRIDEFDASDLKAFTFTFG
jgi:thiol-disulfide isomerase/thioredoxin